MIRHLSRGTKTAIKRGFATLYRSVGAPSDGTRVLMYHSVGSGPLAQSAHSFEQQMRLIRDEYDVIDGSAFRPGSNGGDARVLVTFDDGYRDNYEVAAPILQRLGIGAVFFVVTGLLHGQYQPARAGEFGLYENTPLMTWDHVRELHRAGMTIGSHTNFHADFGKATGARVERQIGLSFEVLRDAAIASPLFAYPFGQAPQLTEVARSALRRHGVNAAFSTIWGPVTNRSDALALPRIRIDPQDTLADFRGKLDGSWDFIRWAQRAAGRS